MSCCRCRERKRFRSLDSAHACTHAAQVNCFVVRKGARGLRTAKIENKIALRSVQNADIFLDGLLRARHRAPPGRQLLQGAPRCCMYICIQSVFIQLTKVPGQTLAQSLTLQDEAHASCPSGISDGRWAVENIL